ncbi:integrin beta pat-3-like [Choristoneura fumiferana]|uniref:integrin beta pat-3-like n=1 Tax=Choristoneura fumiferana TaxID=7141 RepID=UPI003D155845
MKRQLLCFILFSCGQVLSQRPCDRKTCHECISDPNLCAWCSSQKFTLENRCRPLSTSSSESWCLADDIQNPKSNITLVESKDFNHTFGHVIQLKPQKYHLDIRVGQPTPFNFTYKMAENFPVDIYFLLDMSKSMETIRDDLLQQSNDIYNTMRNLTKDVYLGLGTFIDKNMLQFQENVDANETYSFKHQLSLTDNMTAFNLTLNGTNFGNNVDPPESGLDGIAQVIACKKLINWRDQSRKILIHITDASYHSAGDGMLAGLTRPYDGKCYLNEEGYYEMEKEMDYPSVGLISKMATDEQITILFVSSSTDESPYFNLMNAIYGSYTANNYDTHVITSTLKNTYESITQKIELRVNVTSQNKDYFNITFEPNCGEIFNDESACTVEKGEEKHFTGTITLLKYFDVGQLYLGINPKGLKEDISLNINVIKDCGCDGRMEKNSSICNNAGDLNCGVCECYEDKFGQFCGCSSSHSDCKANGTDVECSGQGTCMCGTCEGHCRNGYSGKYCQINISNCPKGKLDLLCSGNGDCSDGVCTCNAGWTGKACECPESKADCIHNGMECNNRGRCHCGQCKCFELSQWDVRLYHDNICGQNPCSDSHCHEKQCEKLIPCFKCYNDKDQCEDICEGNVTIMKTPEVIEEFRSKWTACTNVRVDFGCYANFAYIYSKNETSGIVLFVLGEKNCQENQMMIGVISAVVLLLIGLLTLIAWKVLTTLQDRREYLQFQKKMQESASEQVNEVYRAPFTTYLNPAFQVSPSDTDD